MPSMMHAAILLAEILVSGVWITAVLAVCVTVCLLLLPTLPARFRSLLWMLTFTVAAAMPMALLSHQPDPGSLVPPAHLRLHGAWALPLAFGWVVLSLYRGYRLVGGAWHLRRVTRRAMPNDDLSAWVAGQSGGTFLRHVRVRVSDEVDRPSVVGYRHPTILLPADVLRNASESDLQQILLHEVQHVRRFDDCTNLLQKIAVAVFPFNPALLWMERRLCLERELACDDAVLQATGAPKAYATCLTQMAERSLVGKAGLLAVAAFGRPSELSRRVYRILQWPPRQPSRVVYGMASAVMLCGLGAGTVALERFGLPVSFADVLPAVASVEAHPLPMALSDGPARLVPVIFTLPERRVGARASVHLSRSVVKLGHPGAVGGRPVRVSVALPSDTSARSRTHLKRGVVKVGYPGWEYAGTMKADVERSAGLPVEQLIEYTAEPVERDAAPPMLQQIAMPYAVIPTWSGWLIVQL